jgi:hypothetical protein
MGGPVDWRLREDREKWREREWRNWEGMERWITGRRWSTGFIAKNCLVTFGQSFETSVDEWDWCLKLLGLILLANSGLVILGASELWATERADLLAWGLVWGAKQELLNTHEGDLWSLLFSLCQEPFPVGCVAWDHSLGDWKLVLSTISKEKGWG